MSKKIVVDSCEHCPLRECWELENSVYVHVCRHEHTNGIEITDTSIIHPNCPLEENKPSCTCHD